MEGGIANFPGLSQPFMIDSDQLSRQESDELKRLVKATRFFVLPTTMGSRARLHGYLDHPFVKWALLEKVLRRRFLFFRPAWVFGLMTLLVVSGIARLAFLIMRLFTGSEQMSVFL
jgi:hypothetical protein